jgi:hypothetical protein
MRCNIFTNEFLFACFASGAWYSWLLWTFVLLMWLSFVMFLVDLTAYWDSP